jgi:hypothetical protein
MESPRFTHPFYAEPDLFLCVDDALIASSDNVTQEFCPLKKHPKPVLQLTSPWEGGDGNKPGKTASDPVACSILYDRQLSQYTAWYNTANRQLAPIVDPALGNSARLIRPEGSTVCLATSKDGLTWEKPALGQVPFQGSYANNMLHVAVPPVQSDHLSTVAPNFLPGAPCPLVGSIYSTFDDPLYKTGITQMHSPDGVSWTPHFPPTLPLDGDAHCLMWDPNRQIYLCTSRSAQHARIIARLKSGPYPQLPNKRHIALAMSRDLKHWTPMLDILEADEKDPENAQLYMMYIVPYGHTYLGFVELFYMAPGMLRGPLEMQMALSTDLINWRRIGNRQPFIPRGPKGAWDAGHTLITTNPPFPEGNNLRFWFGGKNTEHWQAGASALSTGTIRRDGFGCWHAGTQTGTITTKPFNVKWATWPMLNIHAPKGQVKMEILAENGQPVPGCSAQDCNPLTGDHLRAQVTFNSKFQSFVRHTGKVQFRFHLKNARLYAFKAQNATLA